MPIVAAFIIPLVLEMTSPGTEKVDIETRRFAAEDLQFILQSEYESCSVSADDKIRKFKNLVLLERKAFEISPA